MNGSLRYTIPIPINKKIVNRQQQRSEIAATRRGQRRAWTWACPSSLPSLSSTDEFGAIQLLSLIMDHELHDVA